MSDQPENLAAILAEMRGARNAASDITLVPTDWLTQWADRIEAAAKRERAETKDYFAKLHDGPSMICTAKNCSLRNDEEDIVEQVKAEASLGHFAPVVVEDRPVCNAAVMRGALEYVRDLMRKVQDGDHVSSAAFLSVVEHALALPARNCDKHLDEHSARLAYQSTLLATGQDAFSWLFSPAEGGAE